MSENYEKDRTTTIDGDMTDVDSIGTGESAVGNADELRKSLLELLASRAGEISRDEELAGDDEDFDEDDEDYDEEFDEDDEDYDEEFDEDEECPAHSSSKVPVGKRVILRSDYKSNKAYCDAVVKSMQAVLRKHRVHIDTPRSLRDGIKVFSCDRTTRGVDIDFHLLVEYEICNFRMDFVFNIDNLPGRTPIIDYFCQESSFRLRYGVICMDHNDGEKKIEYSSCFYGAFSEEVFERYFDALESTVKVYCKDYEGVASGKKLDSDQRRIVRNMLSELSMNLPARVKPENEEKFNLVAEALGSNLSSKNKRLLNYIIEHIN